MNIPVLMKVLILTLFLQLQIGFGRKKTASKDGTELHILLIKH